MRNLVLSSIVLAATLCVAVDAAAQGGSPVITLDVRNAPSSGSDGYTNTTASNDKVYSYKYSGGAGGGGDIIFKGRGNATAVLHLKSDRRYSIGDVTFNGDEHEQLSQSPNSPTTTTIKDKNDAEQTAQYKVTVKDSTADATIPCDPKIINQ